MSEQRMTFMMVSDRKGITRKFVISTAYLKAICIFAVIGTVFFSAIILDYLSLLMQTSENQRLRVKNTQMVEQVASLKGKMDILEGEMKYFRTFMTKLKIIMMPSAQDDNNLVIGPLGPGTLHDGIDAVENEISSMMFSSDSDISDIQEDLDPSLKDTSTEDPDALFFKSPPLNLENGQLTVEDKKDYALLNIRLDRAIDYSKLQRQDGLKLWEALSQRYSLLQATPTIAPITHNGWISSRFGYRISPYTQRPSLHQGLDIAARPGTPVKATGHGVVTYSGYDGGYGKLVSIDHGYGIVTRYGHNSEVFVKIGQKVTRGEVIATVGNTGRTTGPHLHYEVRLNDLPVNPENYILSDENLF